MSKPKLTCKIQKFLKTKFSVERWLYIVFNKFLVAKKNFKKQPCSSNIFKYYRNYGTTTVMT